MHINLTKEEMVETPLSLAAINDLKHKLSTIDIHSKRVAKISFLFFMVIIYIGLNFIWTSDFLVNLQLGDRIMPTSGLELVAFDYRITKTRMSWSIIYFLFATGISFLLLMGIDRLFVKSVNFSIDGENIMLMSKDIQPAKKLDQKIINRHPDNVTMYQNILNQGRDVRKFEYDFMKRLARKRNWLS